MRKIQSCPSRVKREGTGSWLGSVEMIVASMSFRGNVLQTVQELRRWKGHSKRDYPANTGHNVMPRASFRTKTASLWRKLNQPRIIHERSRRNR